MDIPTPNFDTDPNIKLYTTKYVDSNTTDTIGLYNRLLIRDGKDKDIIKKINPDTVSASLVVVDMQKDFIDEIFPEGRGPGGIGAFAVADGAKMVDDLGSFIKSNIDNFTRVVFTRDSHDKEHCSFLGQSGIYPEHCEINSVGGEFPDKWDGLIETLKGKMNVDVVFKGMHPNVESYGTGKYSIETEDLIEYAKKRQSGKKCCSANINVVEEGNSCSNWIENTGGKYLKDRNSAFDKRPFGGEEAKKYDQVKDVFDKDFDVSSLLPKDTQTKHNIYIVGLAADFCVKDTAINISRLINRESYPNVNVYVLAKWVRYAFVPIALFAPVEGTFNTTDERVDKGVNKYIFNVDGDEKRQATKDELKELQKENSDKTGYKRFLTDHNEIINDYASAGVFLTYDTPFVPATGEAVIGPTETTAGGKKTSKRRRRQRLTKKQKIGKKNKSRRVRRNKTMKW